MLAIEDDPNLHNDVVVKDNYCNSCKNLIIMNYKNYKIMDLFNKPLSFQQNKILRKTGEKVEVVACVIKQPGMRSDDDWVTYIDSTGKEHIREHLNIQLDFKDEQVEKFDELLNVAKQYQSPSIRNQRIFEIAKVCVEQHGNILTEDEIVKYATSLVDKIGIEYDNK